MLVPREWRVLDLACEVIDSGQEAELGGSAILIWTVLQASWGREGLGSVLLPFTKTLGLPEGSLKFHCKIFFCFCLLVCFSFILKKKNLFIF